MKIRILLISVLCLLAAGCGNDGPAEPAAFTAFIGLDDKTVGPEATDVVTVLFAATAGWTASSNCDWLTATPDSGQSGDALVTVRATANTGRQARMGSVRFTCGDDKRTLHVTQNGDKTNPDPEPTYGPLLTDGYSSELHFSTSRLRTTSAVMQSFDISSSGEVIYYTQLNNKFRVYLSWNNRNSQETPTARCMTLCYTGHGSNFTLEEASDGKYVWIDNYSPKNASGEYWNAQVISRIPVKAGTTVKAFETTENYYFGEKNISVAVDIAGDMLTILGISTGRIRTYRLSDLKALPVEDITLEEITYGGEDKTEDPETTLRPVVKARDGRKLTPLGDFSIVRQQYSDGTQVS